MTQIWKDKKAIPVTQIEVQPNTVSLVRTKERDGYTAVQVSCGRTKRESKMPPDHGLTAGTELTVELFHEGDMVRVSGYSKGRGFQGVVKRYGFGGGPKTHGQKNRHRAPGSIGSTAPQRVVPGRRMAGHMGTERVTVKSIRIVAVQPEKNLLLVRGAVPGARGGIVEIKKIKSASQNPLP